MMNIKIILKRAFISISLIVMILLFTVMSGKVSYRNIYKSIPVFKDVDYSLDLSFLVNYENEVPDDYNAYLIEYNDHVISSYILDDLQKMIENAKLNGVSLEINNAYRSRKVQEKVFLEQVLKFQNMGYSYNDAKIEAQKTVNLPGYSEHETGLAIDFSCCNYEKNIKMWKWLKDNAYKYGFILRYPDDKVDITKIDYEAWHYRYVGISVAKYLYENELCLEEYVKEETIVKH